MSLITKIIASELDPDFIKISTMAPEDRHPTVEMGVRMYQQYAPTAFENVDVVELTEQDIIDEIAPTVAAGLVLLDLMGEDAASALVGELRDKANLDYVGSFNEPEESEEEV